LGLDYLLSLLERRGVRTKFLAVGSLAGLEAAKRGECDLAGIHLLDPASGEYNRPFLVRTLELIPGYGRLQGIVFRPGDKRFAGRNVPQAVAAAVGDPHCQLVNRNAGSGTRLLIDQLLAGERPSGYAFQTRNHAAVAAAVAQGRADWGVCIRPAAERAGLGFLPLAHEQYDFVTPKSRQHSAAVRMFVQVLAEVETQAALREMGMRIA
jgi:putative molybdopterin biosynthesis protein